jgi:hypothetical protein
MVRFAREGDFVVVDSMYRLVAILPANRQLGMAGAALGP